MRTSTAMAATALVSIASAQKVTKGTCVDGLYMLVARGTEEPKGTGATGAIADRIADRIKDSRIDALDYPATFTDPLYPESVEDGADQMLEVVKDYIETCPDGKIAVLGYSQGAQVSSTTFCGGSTGTDKTIKPLPKKLVEDHVIAISLFGDPTHVDGTKYDLGTSSKDGIFTDLIDTKVCDNYSDMLRSYCDTGDVYCDSGDVRSVHGGYVERYGEDVVRFVIQRWNKATGSKVDDKNVGGPFPARPSGNSTETPTPSVTPPVSTSTKTESTPTSSETGGAGGKDGNGNGGSSGSGGKDEGGDKGAAAGLSAAGSILFGAPLMALALWNVL